MVEEIKFLQRGLDAAIVAEQCGQERLSANDITESDYQELIQDIIRISSEIDDARADMY